MRLVVIWGSRRFRSEIREFERQLIEHSVVVFEPHLHEGGEEWQEFSEEYKDFVLMGLAYDHFQ